MTNKTVNASYFRTHLSQCVRETRTAGTIFIITYRGNSLARLKRQPEKRKMTIKTIGIRELKANLSQYLQEISSGSTIVVTEHHRSVATLGPAEDYEDVSLRDHMIALRESGVLNWRGQLPSHYTPRSPVVKLKTDQLASDLLLEDRR